MYHISVHTTSDDTLSFTSFKNYTKPNVIPISIHKFPFYYSRKSRHRTSLPMSRTGSFHAIFCFTSATMAFTACCIRVM